MLAVLIIFDCGLGGARTHHAANAVRRRVGRLLQVQVGGPHAGVYDLRGVEEECDLRRRRGRLERRHHDLRKRQV